MTMKTLITIIIAFAVCLSISGQQITQSNNHYRGNDALEKKQAMVKGFDLNSKNSIWSQEDAELSKATYQAEYTTETDTLMAIERGSRTYYRQNRDVVSIQCLRILQRHLLTRTLGAGSCHYSQPKRGRNCPSVKKQCNFLLISAKSCIFAGEI